MFLFGLILLQACVGPPDQALNWRKQWELLILTEDGGMVDASGGVGDYVHAAIHVVGNLA